VTRGTDTRVLEKLLCTMFTRGRNVFSGATPVSIKADEVLFVAGDAGDGCYRIEDGLFKVTMVSRFGKERILAFLGPGALVGELSIIDGQPRSATAVAMRDSALSFLSRDAFADFAQKHPEVYESLVRLLATRLREIDNVVAAGSFLPRRGRVAYTLLELAKHFGQDIGSGRVLIRQKIGQSDLAAMTGVVRETVNRILNDWKRCRVVSRLSDHYCLENRIILQKEADTLDGACGAWLSPVRLADVPFATFQLPQG
jgi:CRP/FNR family transcriptional regulator, cyclic AMP receptor protein